MSETQRKFECYDCKHEWGEPYGTGRPARCPKCESTNIHRHPDDRGGRGRGNCGGRHGNGDERKEGELNYIKIKGDKI